MVITHFLHFCQLPGYGYLSGLQNKGYISCAPCGPEQFQGERLEAQNKIVFLDNAKYLPMEHWMRGAGALGLSNLAPDLQEVPTPKTPLDWFHRWADIQNGLLGVEDSGMKRLSILYKLPYWKVR